LEPQTGGGFLTYIPWFIAALLTGSFFLAINIIWNKFNQSVFALFISFFWVGLVYLANLFQYPLTFAATLSFSNFWFINAFSGLGFYGLEFLIALSACIPIILLNTSQTLSMITILILFIASAVPLISKQSSEKNLRIAAVQPSIEHSDYLAASWSLYERKKIEEKVDSLTMQGLSSRPDIVLWPEGANGLDNFNIPRRLSQLFRFRNNGHSELLLTGYEYENGLKFNSAVLVTTDGSIQAARKSRPAPIAEANLMKGSPTILRSTHGNLGIVICFDSLFNEYFNDLTQMNSDFFLIVTDDSSLARTNLPYVHGAYAVLFSAIYKKPVIFANNNGVSFSTTSRGGILKIDYSGELPQVYDWIITSNIKSPGWLVLHQYFYLAFLALLLLGLVRRPL
jgi:apolipoprotein N-acyltransferase